MAGLEPRLGARPAAALERRRERTRGRTHPEDQPRWPLTGSLNLASRSWVPRMPAALGSAAEGSRAHWPLPVAGRSPERWRAEALWVGSRPGVREGTGRWPRGSGAGRSAVRLVRPAPGPAGRPVMEPEGRSAKGSPLGPARLVAAIGPGRPNGPASAGPARSGRKLRRPALGLRPGPGPRGLPSAQPGQMPAMSWERRQPHPPPEREPVRRIRAKGPAWRLAAAPARPSGQPAAGLAKGW